MWKTSILPIHGVYTPRKGLFDHSFFIHAMKPEHERRQIEKEKALEKIEISMIDSDPAIQKQGKKAYEKYMKDVRGKGSKRKAETDEIPDSNQRQRKTICFG